MAQRITIPNILDLTDDYFKNIKLKDEMKKRTAIFINLKTSLDLILPVKFCYGARVFTQNNTNNAKNAEIGGKPSLTYDIYTEENPKGSNLEQDRIVFKNINKIAETLKKEFESLTSPDIVTIRNRIIRKNQKITIVGCKEVIPERQAIKGKYAIYIPIEIQPPDEPPKRFVTQITNLKHEILNPSEIVNGKDNLNMGNYSLMISITGITIVNDKITMTILCKKCAFERKGNEYQERVDSIWKDVVDKRRMESQLSNTDEIKNEEKDVVDEFSNINDGVISQDDLKEYEEQIVSLSIKN